MALRKRGKSGFWHAYFRTTVALPDGGLKYASTTVNLYTDDLLTARALEAELMAKARAVRQHQRATARMRQMEIAAGLRPASDMPPSIIREKRARRLTMENALATAAKYKSVGKTTAKLFRSFARDVGLKYMDEVTPEIAFDYLCRKCPASTSGKSFNNIRSALNGIFRLTLLDAGLKESPFARIPNRALLSRHQRPFTEEEFIRIYRAAPEPWKTAVLIAWFTGLRQKDVFLLRWDQISGDILTTVPAKTARFGRAVQIPLHPQLLERLQSLPRAGERVLGAWPYYPNTIAFRRFFGDLLRQLGIGDTDQGFVAFNSFRDSFVTRCDEAGVPRHAVRGMVGHASDDMTDLYSHDLASARRVQQLPPVKLDETP